MNPRIFLLLAACLLLVSTYAQKKIFSYPFEFEKSFLAKSDYDAYFLDNPANNTFALVLKDNKKIEYALVDQNFKVVSKVSSDIGNTVFDIKNLKDCTGGTTNGHQYHFIYPESKSEYEMETIDFDAKTISHKKLIELPKEEKPLASFSDNNVFYALTTNDKAGTLTISTANAAGELLKKSISFPIPEEASRHRDKLSEYLGGLKIIKGSEFPDLSNAVKSAKLFTTPDQLVIVINDGDNPAHIVTLQLPGFSLQEKKIDYSNLVPKEEKGKVYVSSFLKGNRLFSLVLNKKNIRIVVNDLESGAQLNKIEINDDEAFALFADGPFTERRLGKKDDVKDINDIKKLIKAFTKGTEGLMVTENKTGQLVLTVGTYDLIPLNTGSGGGYVGGFENNLTSMTPGLTNHGGIAPHTTVWNPYLYYRPGMPGYTTTNARYYNTTYFRLLLDPNNFKTVRGRVPTPVPDQIKDYIETVDKKAKATNQFAIGKSQYYGYYDRDTKNYVVEQIRIAQ